MKTFLLLGCFVGVASAFRAANLINQTHHTEESLKTFQAKLNELSEVQRKIFQKINGNTGPILAKRPTPTIIDLNKEVQTKPDKLPYLFEGDIVLTEKQMDRILRKTQERLLNESSRSKRSMTSDLSERWTFPIPYYISTNTGVSESAVLAGIEKWQSDTCVTFTRLNYLPNGQNCLNFILGDGCYSYIGKSSLSPQPVSIGNGCTSLGTVTHEIGHALGFYHEQSRWDRDSYVKILTQNIQNVYLNQFTAVAQGLMVDYGVPYDLGSVMHYDQFSFSDDNLQTIQTLDRNYQNTIGQRVAPSFADIKRINFAYCNASCSATLDCQNGGYTDPKNCQQCRCPDGFGGTLCDRATSGPAVCGVGDLTATEQLQTIQARGAINCPYLIKAPTGKKIFFQIGTFSFTNWPPCTFDYLEIKYNSNQELTGARFCTNFPSNSLSATNQLVVLYHGSQNSAFSLNYRYDPVTPVATIAPPTTTPTVPTTVNTSTQSIWTFFPHPTTTSSLNAWTFFPQTVLPGCSQWQQCTAQCGGCGTRSRYCNGRWQTEYCNMRACSNERCCAPFRNRFGECQL